MEDAGGIGGGESNENGNGGNDGGAALEAAPLLPVEREDGGSAALAISTPTQLVAAGLPGSLVKVDDWRKEGIAILDAAPDGKAGDPTRTAVKEAAERVVKAAESVDDIERQVAAAEVVQRCNRAIGKAHGAGRPRDRGGRPRKGAEKPSTAGKVSASAASNYRRDAESVTDEAFEGCRCGRSGSCPAPRPAHGALGRRVRGRRRRSRTGADAIGTGYVGCADVRPVGEDGSDGADRGRQCAVGAPDLLTEGPACVCRSLPWTDGGQAGQGRNRKRTRGLPVAADAASGVPLPRRSHCDRAGTRSTQLRSSCKLQHHSSRITEGTVRRRKSRPPAYGPLSSIECDNRRTFACGTCYLNSTDWVCRPRSVERLNESTASIHGGGGSAIPLKMHRCWCIGTCGFDSTMGRRMGHTGQALRGAKISACGYRSPVSALPLWPRRSRSWAPLAESPACRPRCRTAGRSLSSSAWELPARWKPSWRTTSSVAPAQRPGRAWGPVRGSRARCACRGRA